MPLVKKIACSLALLLAASVVVGCGTAPRAMSEQAFAERVTAHEARSLAQRDEIAARLLRRLEYRHAEQLGMGGTDEPFTYEVLMLSSGGQFGAFGVGVLQGWSKVQDSSLQRPEFDLVTGVSTGALIAPFSLLGTDDSIERIDQLYREASDRLATLRGLLFFLPKQPSFFDNRALADRIATELDLATVREIADAHAEHRKLLLGSTDLDLGRFRIWDVGPRAVHALETEDLSEIHSILLSSASIPAAFPPVDIDGVLYTDGAVAQAAFVGLDREEIVQVFREFTARNPGAAMPKLRFWIIVNGFLDVDPELIRLSWVPVARRSTEVLTSYGMRVTLRHMQFGVELLARDLDTQADFFYLAVPHDLELPLQTERLFDPQVMQVLAAEGRRLGRDPSSWRTEVLAPEIPGSALQVDGVLPEAR
ncbi:patatin-like phospholipase family protein [Thioalkalivibrio sp.]|uniref:patatin-like phospholipase family protein n=1 Tax=Thioalkalivibrio sp. TaxID=2093813 RepID=UPI0012D6A381|nr:patatin-like phospholipase family protein [Thioalkalivibrio sp.]TVP80602.1 MAG: patatin-like phospholipase family protein [Thioalkalivibrio sp.]